MTDLIQRYPAVLRERLPGQCECGRAVQVVAFNGVPDIVHIDTAAQVDPASGIDAQLACPACRGEYQRRAHIHFQQRVHGPRIGVADVAVVPRDATDVFGTEPLLAPGQRVAGCHRAHAGAEPCQLCVMGCPVASKMPLQAVLEQRIGVDGLVQAMAHFCCAQAFALVPDGGGLCAPRPRPGGQVIA